MKQSSFFNLNFCNMASQSGILPLTGSIGNITFFKSGSSFHARQKSGIDKARYATDPKFRRTRENAAEFGKGAKAAKLLRGALKQLLKNAVDKKTSIRLSAEMRRILKTDPVNKRGARKVVKGDLALLKGYDFNAFSKLSSVLYASFAATIARSTGTLSVHVPPFVPEHLMTAPEGSTHFRIVSAGVEIDFENEKAEKATSQSNIFPINETPTADMTLENTLKPNSTMPLFLALGLQFYQEVNGEMYPLSGASNSLAIVEVSQV
jgi:hypothetical protein